MKWVKRLLFGTWTGRLLARVEGQLELIYEAGPPGTFVSFLRTPAGARLMRLATRLAQRASKS